MNDQAASVQTPSPAAPRRVGQAAAHLAAAQAAPLWHLGWGVAGLAAAAALMAALGALSPAVAGALALGAAPGLLGYFWRPCGQQRLGLLLAWAAGAVAAAAVVGGVTGPLAVWCAAPLLAGALIGAPAEGVVLAACALAVTALLQFAGLVGAPPAGPFAVGLAAAGLVTLGGAAAAALGIMMHRDREHQTAHLADQAWMRTVMAELPHLALALDNDGRCEGVFGSPLPGLTLETLGDGLVAAAADADRERVRAAVCEALDHGVGEATFRPAAAPDRLMALALRRRGEEGLSALLREAEPLAPPVSEDADGEAAARAQAVWRDQTAIRVQALENSWAAAAAARDQALAELTQARAARAAAETAREQAEASAVAKSRFLANMSHELRTPLNAIMGFSDIMRARMFGDLAPKYAEYAELIHESGRHLTDLINDVLDMSKIEAERYSLDLDVFDAREPVSAALRLMRLQADDAGVQLRGVLPQQAMTVEADRRALKQIVLNLVSNALKFTPAGGSITVTLQAVEGAAELVVADTGVGIAKQDLERLGRPYEQAGDAEQKAQGTGLGLSLVRAFARLHGGEMNIESELGEGVAVTVRLPVLHEEEEPAPPPMPAAAPEPQAIAIGDNAAPAGEADAQTAPKSAEIIPLNLPRA